MAKRVTRAKRKTTAQIAASKRNLVKARAAAKKGLTKKSVPKMKKASKKRKVEGGSWTGKGKAPKNWVNVGMRTKKRSRAKVLHTKAQAKDWAKFQKAARKELGRGWLRGGAGKVSHYGISVHPSRLGQMSSSTQMLYRQYTWGFGD